MDKIIITGEISEPLSEDDMDKLFDMLGQLGITEVEVKEG